MLKGNAFYCELIIQAQQFPFWSWFKWHIDIELEFLHRKPGPQNYSYMCKELSSHDQKLEFPFTHSWYTFIIIKFCSVKCLQGIFLVNGNKHSVIQKTAKKLMLAIRSLDCFYGDRISEWWRDFNSLSFISFHSEFDEWCCQDHNRKLNANRENMNTHKLKLMSAKCLKLIM